MLWRLAPVSLLLWALGFALTANAAAHVLLAVAVLLALGTLLDQLAAQQPALVLLDIGLPVVDGYGVAAALRQRYGDEVPVVVVTADGSAAEKARKVAAAAYLHKPFELDELIATIRQNLPA